MEGAHHFLLAALKVTEPAVHPPAPFHGGGPALKIDAHAYVVGALWLASRVARYVEERDRAQFDRWVSLAKAQLAVGSSDVTNQKELYSADAAKARRVPAKIGCWAAHEAANWAWRPIYAGGAARPAAANLARFLVKEHRAEVRAYLADLDAFCIHLDAMTALRDRNQTTKAPVKATLWRGHEDGKVAGWLMALEDGDLALLQKEKTRWRLTEGPPEEVLATVTTSHFEAATMAYSKRAR